LARKILLADDSVTAQNMGRKILADAGYEVLTVNNGSAALKKIAEAKPEIIILDVYMPGYSGLEVCQRLKEAQETSRIPVLLTVGKLEPFKPEEAKRVRADGYIVKPFEASELLSALSKLEDKIVPRPEAAKPGRFARANAAIDESRYDKSVAVDEDSGWKNRIAFPPKKKASSEPEDGDDPAIYNALNKDLRTVVEHKPVEHKPIEKPHEAKPESPKVNLEALAPEGLPKDVTPEEIAALAAAAAQVKGKIAESKIGEVGPGQAVASHADVAAVESKPIGTTTVEAKTNTSESTQSKEPQSVDAPKVSDATAVPAPVEQKTAEQKPEDKTESAHETSSEIAPSSTDVMAAIAALETSASTATQSGNGFSLRRSSDEPVTMAMAAGAEYAVAPSRWRAVPVALESDEISLSLEHEMQNAYAPVAAESAPAQPVSMIAEVPPVVAEPVAAPEPVSSVQPSPVEPSLIQAEHTQPVISVVEPPVIEPPVVEPEVAQSIHAVANAATEAISAAVKELEAVAASYEAQRPPVADVNSAPIAIMEPSAPTAPESAPAVESKAEDKLVEAAVISEPEPKQEIAPEPVCEQQAQEEQKQESPVPFAEIVKDAVEPSVAISAEKLEAAPPDELAAGGIRDVGKKESEIAQSTAAAWASWRRIRETGDATAASAEAPRSNSEPKERDPRDVSAMAVAAGAESAPQEPETATDPDAGELASIVDSVLADLRPKIMAEISRKMGKKK
jgi:CheY-like chemotaxis protein